MQRNRTESAWRLGTALHAFFDNIVREPLPERWVDLIKRLSEEERNSASRKTGRQEVTAMIDASQIKEQMEVKGSDGKHVGTVFAVENGRIVLASGGIEHIIELGAVEAVTDGVVHLRKTADETVRPWH
jgi:hypothetical protein